MRMTSFRKLLPAFISVSLLGTAIYGYGCADGWWGYTYISSFTPEAFADDSYKPLFYAPEEKFYDYAQLEYIDKYNDDITADWKTYLGDQLSETEISFYLLNDSAQAGIDEKYQAMQRPQRQSAKNTADSRDAKLRNFFSFLHYAKRIEQSSTTTFSSWDYEDRILNQTEKSVVDEVEAVYQAIPAKDDFYKNRMWFQVLKAKFYAADRAAVIPFFEATQGKQPKNQLYYRAIGYLAGAYYQLGDYEQSNSLFALLFNDVAKLRHEALYNFKPMSSDSLEHALKRSSRKDVQASMVAMNGYYTDAGEAMKKLYRIQPESPHIDFLLTRWVNAQEYIVNDYNSASKAATAWDSPELDRETISWLAGILKAPKKLHNPSLAYLAYGYTNMFIRAHDVANTAYRDAKKYANEKPLVQAQIRLLNLINEVAQVEKVDKTTENALLPDLVWLYQTLPKDSVISQTFRYDYAANWIKESLAATYVKHENPIMAELLSSQKGFYDDKNLGDQMEHFLLKDDKSAWEKLFIAQYPYNLSDIYESRAIYAYYQNRIDEAIVLMEKAVPAKPNVDYGYDHIYYSAATLRGNPFNGRIKDCNDCDHAAPQKITYTKLDFLKKVKVLQTNVDAGTDVYTNALLLGNAYYNSTYYGNARVFYYNQIIEEYGNYISTKNQPYLLGMEQAEKYYNIALKNARTNEQRAKVSYLLAKVERNNFYRTAYLAKDAYYWAEADQTMFKAWKGFQALKSQYADTQYYQDVIGECGYFQKYVNQENSKSRY